MSTSIVKFLLPTAREGNVFRNACLFTKGKCLPPGVGCLPRGEGGRCLRGAGGVPLEFLPPGGTTAVDTHPTGMNVYSYLLNNYER